MRSRERTDAAPPVLRGQTSQFEGVTQNILKSLDDAVALIAIMHDRGRVVFSGKPDKGTRGET